MSPSSATLDISVSKNLAHHIPDLKNLGIMSPHIIHTTFVHVHIRVYLYYGRSLRMTPVEFSNLSLPLVDAHADKS